MATSKRTCSIDGCDAPHLAKGLCSKHYSRERKAQGKVSPNQCTIEGCGKPMSGKGYCQPHYDKWRRRGDPLWEREVLSCRVADCDREHYGKDLCWMHYLRARRTGSTELRERETKYCNVESCGRELEIPYGRGMCGKHYQKWRTTGDPLHSAIESFVCAVCGDDYEAAPRQNRYCSETCSIAGLGMAWRRRHKRLADARVESFRRVEIFERDKWKCHLCGGDIPASLTWPHPESPSIDHIVPLSKGGLHSRANVAASHLLCNVKKGAKVPA